MDRNHRISIEVRSIIPVAIVTRVVPETIPAPATVLLVVTILIVVWLGYLSFRSESLSLKALINFIPPLTSVSLRYKLLLAILQSQVMQAENDCLCRDASEWAS